MKNRLLVFLASVTLVGSVVSAADLTGTWRIDHHRAGGVTLHSYFVFEQHGDQLAGKVVINDSVDLPLRNPHREKEGFAFNVDWGTSYTVTPKDGTLQVGIRYNPTAKEEVTAVRVDPKEAVAPATVPPPALHPVPYNGLAKTPPMGWNSWNHFAGDVDDRIVRETADALVSTGMAAAGYVYVNIDDTWEAERDADGNIQCNGKFPDMKALAEYVHSRGLKIGIYSSPGPRTCGGYLGSYGHEEQDAKTFAAWGIDYLKYDWCSASRVYSDDDLQPIYQRMGEALLKSGRPIVYSLCEYGTRDVWKWGAAVGGNLWRTTGDISDNWDSMTKIGFDQGRLAPYAGPGHWNDPDMLEVGNGGMTDDEYRTHFSLWCMLAAPLMAGNDLRHMSPATLAILTNREVIAIDQDELGHQATRFSAKENVEVWTKPLSGGRRAVAIFNRGDAAKRVNLTWTEFGLEQKPSALRDAWEHKDVSTTGDAWSGELPKHGVVVLVAK